MKMELLILQYWKYRVIKSIWILKIKIKILFMNLKVCLNFRNTYFYKNKDILVKNVFILILDLSFFETYINSLYLYIIEKHYS